jgi:hypothetical protein
MSALGAFLQNNGLTDPKLINYMTKTLQLESVTDFASYWTSDEFEKGVQTDVVQKVADVSLPSSKLQVARLRAAWKLAQGQPAGPITTQGAPAKTTTGGQVIGMGWTSPEVTTSTWDGLWEALIFKARNPEKFKMDVSNVVVADRPGYLARSMTINSSGATVQEHIYASERKGEIIYRIVDPGTKRETDDERVIAVKDGPLRMEFFHRHVSDGYRTFWQAPLDSVQQMIQELVDYAAKTEGKGGVVGLGIRSDEIKGVSHDSLWRSMMESIREPARFFACSDVSIKECKGFLQRAITANGETYVENATSHPARSSTASSSTAPRPTLSVSSPCVRTPCRLSSTRGTQPTASGCSGTCRSPHPWVPWTHLCGRQNSWRVRSPRRSATASLPTPSVTCRTTPSLRPWTFLSRSRGG